ncbi:hypothetical protein B0H14DRAFT_2402970, partial [Mycena olivaceomarginata]
TWKTALGLSWNEDLAEPTNHGKEWNGCKYAVARSEDPCFPGSWVFCSDGSEVTAGRITTILVPEGTASDACAVVIMQRFAVSDTTDGRFDMPLLINMNKIVLVKPEHILFKFNAQHDCQYSGCRLMDARGPQQERSESLLTVKTVIHSDDLRFLLNMHALHNGHLIREILPAHLTELQPCFPDRRAKHFEFAAALRKVGPAKRAEANAKGQATKAKKKQEKADKAEGAKERGDQ